MMLVDIVEERFVLMDNTVPGVVPVTEEEAVRCSAA
jgi:hypothetical protein